jgi:ferredoxin
VSEQTVSAGHRPPERSITSSWRPEVVRIDVDFDRCEGHGLCEQTAPEVYQLDDDGNLTVLVEVVPAELELKAAAGARVCPVAALRAVP